MLSRKEIDEIGDNELIARVMTTIIENLHEHMGWDVDDILQLIDDTRAENCAKYPFLKGLFNRYDELMAKNPEDKTRTDIIELELLLLEIASWEFRNEIVTDAEARKKWLAVALIHNFDKMLATLKNEVMQERRGE